MNEQWLPVPEFEAIYHVSDQGRVRRVLPAPGRSPGFVKGEVMKGYKRVTLYRKWRKQRIFVHRLVLAAFVGASDLSVNHKNGDPSDNRLENLEYLTMADNLRDSWKRGTRDGLNQGSKHGMHKITEAAVDEIRKLGDAGRPQKEIAAMFGVSVPTVSMIVARKTWRHI